MMIRIQSHRSSLDFNIKQQSNQPKKIKSQIYIYKFPLQDYNIDKLAHCCKIKFQSQTANARNISM